VSKWEGKRKRITQMRRKEKEQRGAKKSEKTRLGDSCQVSGADVSLPFPVENCSKIMFVLEIFAYKLQAASVSWLANFSCREIVSFQLEYLIQRRLKQQG
jgi:hypothetical protein